MHAENKKEDLLPEVLFLLGMELQSSSSRLLCFNRFKQSLKISFAKCAADPLVRIRSDALSGLVGRSGPLGRNGVAGLVREAAHEPAAHPRDPARVERQSLSLRHADRHRIEPGHERRAAQRATARPPPSARLRLVAHPDLPEFDPPAGPPAEIPQQLAKIDPLLGGEGDQEGVAIQGDDGRSPGASRG